MKTRSYRTAGASLVAGVGLLLVVAPAQASPDQEIQTAESGAAGGGVLSGNAIAAPISVAVNASCNVNGIGVLGVGSGQSACDDDNGAASQQSAPSAQGSGVLSGNSVAAPISVGVDVCGNANGVAVGGAGIGGADCEGAEEEECPGQPSGCPEPEEECPPVPCPTTTAPPTTAPPGGPSGFPGTTTVPPGITDVPPGVITQVPPGVTQVPPPSEVSELPISARPNFAG